jgi:hypothetical protein
LVSEATKFADQFLKTHDSLPFLLFSNGIIAKPTRIVTSEGLEGLFLLCFIFIVFYFDLYFILFVSNFILFRGNGYQLFESLCYFLQAFTFVEKI